jgi:hypothetical protein
MGLERIGVGRPVDAAEGFGGGADMFAGPGSVGDIGLGVHRTMTGHVQTSMLESALAVWENDNARKVINNLT